MADYVRHAPAGTWNSVGFIPAAGTLQECVSELDTVYATINPPVGAPDHRKLNGPLSSPAGETDPLELWRIRISGFMGIGGDGNETVGVYLYQGEPGSGDLVYTTTFTPDFLGGGNVTQEQTFDGSEIDPTNLSCEVIWNGNAAFALDVVDVYRPVGAAPEPAADVSHLTTLFA